MCALAILSLLCCWRTEIWFAICFDRILVAVQVWSAVALSHLVRHAQNGDLADARTDLSDWCDAVGKADRSNAYRPWDRDIATVRLRIAGHSLTEAPRGQKRPFEATDKRGTSSTAT